MSQLPATDNFGQPSHYFLLEFLAAEEAAIRTMPAEEKKIRYYDLGINKIEICYIKMTIQKKNLNVAGVTFH